MTSNTTQQTHYDILHLPPPQWSSTSPLTAQDIKAAYRTALLKHHPDKRKNAPRQDNHTAGAIDAIKHAYAVLSNPSLKQEYDLSLLRSAAADGKGNFQTGEEILDLDDLDYDEDMSIWYRACRCGEARGYIVTEHVLVEEEAKGGREVVVGCVGCSLWIRVGFAVAEDEDEDNQPA